MVQLQGSPHVSPLQSLRASDDESVVLQDASQALWVWLPSNSGTKCRWLTPNAIHSYHVPFISISSRRGEKTPKKLMVSEL